MERRMTRLGSNKMRLSDAPSQRLLRPWDLTSERRRELFSPSRQVSPPFARLAQPLKAAPRSGRGRLPKAPRVHACEAWPRAPHPTGSGYPSPAKLSLCPTSVTPLEAPLTGQDGSDNKPALGGVDKECENFFSSVFTTS